MICRPKNCKNVPKTPVSLDEALCRLEQDQDFLLRGDVFTSDVVQTWIHYKRVREVAEMRMRRIRMNSVCTTMSSR